MSDYLDSVVVHQNFITAEETQQLIECSAKLVDEGLLCYDRYQYKPSPGEDIQALLAKRGHIRIDRVDIFSRFAILDTVSNRIKQTLNLDQFKYYLIDHTLGWMIHIMQPSGSIQRHTDSYATALKLNWHVPKIYASLRHIRFNIMVSRDSDQSYNPHFILGNKELYKYVDVGDAWCFPADTITHFVPNLQGSKQRLIYQFGFAVDTTPRA